MKTLTEIRVTMAGMAGLLAKISATTADEEIQDQIHSALTDWCKISYWRAELGPAGNTTITPPDQSTKHQCYYLQDRRSYCGNDILWWRKGGGYTTSLSDAATFTHEEAYAQNRSRETDIPWPVQQAEVISIPVVDMQITKPSCPGGE